MTDPITLTLGNKNAREAACRYILEVPEGWMITISPPKRTLAQNNKMWAMLKDIAKQLPTWAGAPMVQEDYKDLLTGSMAHIRFVPAYDCPSRLVGLGQSTKNQTKKYFSDLFILMEKFGVDYGIRYTDYSYRDFIIQK